MALAQAADRRVAGHFADGGERWVTSAVAAPHRAAAAAASHPAWPPPITMTSKSAIVKLDDFGSNRWARIERRWSWASPHPAAFGRHPLPLRGRGARSLLPLAGEGGRRKPGRMRGAARFALDTNPCLKLSSLPVSRETPLQRPVICPRKGGKISLPARRRPRSVRRPDLGQRRLGASLRRPTRARRPRQRRRRESLARLQKRPAMPLQHKDGRLARRHLLFRQIGDGVKKPIEARAGLCRYRDRRFRLRSKVRASKVRLSCAQTASNPPLPAPGRTRNRQATE